MVGREGELAPRCRRQGGRDVLGELERSVLSLPVGSSTDLAFVAPDAADHFGLTLVAPRIVQTIKLVGSRDLENIVAWENTAAGLEAWEILTVADGSGSGWVRSTRGGSSLPSDADRCCVRRKLGDRGRCRRSGRSERRGSKSLSCWSRYSTLRASRLRSKRSSLFRGGRRGGSSSSAASS